jgi:hypothetical protein
MKAYTVNIKHLYNKVTRVVEVTESTPMAAHKHAYMKHTKSGEEIDLITDSDGRAVYEYVKGFLR